MLVGHSDTDSCRKKFSGSRVCFDGHDHDHDHDAATTSGARRHVEHRHCRTDRDKNVLHASHVTCGHTVQKTVTTYHTIKIEEPALYQAGGTTMAAGTVNASLTQSRAGKLIDESHGQADDGNNVPLVSIGGTAQLLRWFSGHARHLASGGKSVFTYEARGQGKTSLPVDDASLEMHSTDYARLASAFAPLASAQQADLCGFSFGGRVALAIAAQHPHLVRRLVLTGIAGNRRATGRLIIKGWKQALRNGCAQTFVFNSMLETHGKAFLEQNEHRIAFWANDVARANSVPGLLANITHSHQDDPDHPWSTPALAARVKCPVLLIVGEEDRLAPVEEAVALAEQCGWEVEVVQGAGHTVPLEKRHEWLALTQAFLAQ
eukprot:m.450344 g.450344  ORF g.450344 m.450344 type:complete len:376 (-) comp20320_c4_seq20:444-1571(-)